MGPVFGYVLILWAVVVVAGLVIFVVRRLGWMGSLSTEVAVGFIGGAYGILLGLLTFHGLQHVNSFRDTAQDEAAEIAQASALTGAFPPREGAAARRQLYCYASDVIDRDWPAMAQGVKKGAPIVERRESALYGILLQVGRGNARPANWYDKALAASLQAGKDRLRRLLLSQRQIPAGMWALIYIGAMLMLVLIAWYHSSSRRQATAMLGASILMLTAIVAVLAGFDAPANAPFEVKPAAMEQTRDLMGAQIGAIADPTGFCRALPAPPPTTLG
jgi:hypothetical protein